MNERIRLLWEQAAKTTQGDSWEEQTKFMEKFAELIVFECVNAVMDGTKEGDHYAQLIEQHFDNGTGGVLQFGFKK